MPVRLVSVAMSPSLMVALTTPVVWASMEFACRTVAPSLTVTATLAAVSIVLALIAVTISAALPVSVFTPVAFTATVVLASRLLRAAASADASLTVMV